MADKIIPEQLSLLVLLAQLTKIAEGEDDKYPLHFTCYEIQSLIITKNNVANFKRKIATMRKILDLMEKDCRTIIQKTQFAKDEVQYYEDVPEQEPEI